MSDPEEQPLPYRSTMTDSERFERNGWIGLAITLIVCAVVAIAVLSVHR